MKNNKIYTTKNGKWIIEYPNWSSDFLIYLIKKILVFFIDYSLFYLAIGLLYFLSNVKLWQTLFFSFILFFFYYFLAITLLSGSTVGMKIANLKIINRNGWKKLSKNIIMIRSFFASIIVLPFIGWLFLLVCVISPLLLKGLTATDIFSLTIVADNYYIKRINKIHKN